MSNLGISISSGRVNIRINEEVEEQDIIDMLSFDEEQIEDLLRTHAANQSYWEALAIRLKNRYEIFKDEWHKKWWAHSKVYAKLVLAGYGETKPTIDAINDMVIMIYSVEATPIERDKYASIALNIEVNKRGSPYTVNDLEKFKDSMYKYINMKVPWYFENVIQTLKKMQEDHEVVGAVAEKLNARSFHMQNLMELMMAKKSNIGPRSVDERELMNNVSSQRRK